VWSAFRGRWEKVKVKCGKLLGDILKRLGLAVKSSENLRE
jgi:hypothetical protein